MEAEYEARKAKQDENLGPVLPPVEGKPEDAPPFLIAETPRLTVNFLLAELKRQLPGATITISM